MAHAGFSLCHFLLLAALLLVAYRLVAAAVHVARRREPWTQLLVPGLVGLELTRVALGQSSRPAGIGIVLAAEFALLGCVGWAVSRSAGAGGAPLEQLFYRGARRFFPAALASAMTQEIVTLWSSLYLLRKLPPGAGTPFGYVQDSPLKLLPLILGVGALPEALFFHYALHARPRIALAFSVFPVWAFFWAIGMYVTMRDRPHRVEGHGITLRMGLRKWCHIPLALVESAREMPATGTRRGTCEADRFTMKHCPCLDVKLQEPVPVHFLDGSTHPVDRVWIAADNLSALRAAIRVGQPEASHAR